MNVEQFLNLVSEMVADDEEKRKFVFDARLLAGVKLMDIALASLGVK